MTINVAKLIEVIDPQAGTLRETELKRQPPTPVNNRLFEVNGRRMSLREAEAITTDRFPQLLRKGLRPILFSEYAGWPSTHNVWIDESPSDAEFETGIEFNNLGKAQVVPELGEYPMVQAVLDRSVQIQNQKRGFRFGVSWEMRQYDRIGAIRDLIRDLSGAMAYTEEDDAYTVLTTAGNYTRNSTTGDNDIGANTAATTFSADGLNTAMSTLRTMKDRKSGRYLGVMPNMIVVGVGLEMAAKQLLLSPQLSGMGDTDAVLTYGTGTSNPFRGVIDQIVVSPFLGKYEWVLMQAGRPVKKFVVDDLELLEADMSGNSEAYMTQDALLYRVRKVYGIGMWNDRFAYYSSSSTAPTVD